MRRFVAQGIVITLCVRQAIDHAHKAFTGTLYQIIILVFCMGQWDVCICHLVGGVKTMEQVRAHRRTIQRERVSVVPFCHYIREEMLRNLRAALRVKHLCNHVHRLYSVIP